jgi:hypothetical protein
MDHQPVADSTNNGPAAGSSKHTSYASMLAHAVDDVGHAVSELCNLPATFAEIAPAGEAGVSSDELDWELVGNAAGCSMRNTQCMKMQPREHRRAVFGQATVAACDQPASRMMLPM